MSGWLNSSSQPAATSPLEESPTTEPVVEPALVVDLTAAQAEVGAPEAVVAPEETEAQRRARWNAERRDRRVVPEPDRELRRDAPAQDADIPPRQLVPRRQLTAGMAANLHRMAAARRLDRACVVGGELIPRAEWELLRDDPWDASQNLRHGSSVQEHR